MLENYRSWLEFIRNKLGCLVRVSDIAFVTGCDLTADWATAAFVEKSTECNIDFKAGDPAFGAATASFWGTWQSSVSVPHRCGPGPVRPPSPSDHQSIVAGSSSPREGPLFNQCIFLRSFRVFERKLRAPKVIKAAAEPEDMDMDRDEELYPAISFTSSEESISDSSNDEYGSSYLSRKVCSKHDIE